jgi:hypothetical protein
MKQGDRQILSRDRGDHIPKDMSTITRTSNPKYIILLSTNDNYLSKLYTTYGHPPARGPDAALYIS